MNDLRFVMFPNDDGRDPVNWLFCSRRVMSIGASVPNVEVRVPVKRLLLSRRSVKVGASKGAASGAPVNALLDKTSCCSGVRFRINAGMSPESWLF